MKTVTRLLLLGAILIGLAVAMVIGCGGGDDGDSSASNGSIQVKVTDAPNLGPNIEHIWITIDSVEVHREGGGWVEVMPNAYVSAPLTIDLLEWRNGSSKTLGLDSLPAGHYTQIRLNLGDTPEGGLDNPHHFANYVVIAAGAENEGTHELTIPSGYTSGLKLTHEFDIQADTEYEVILDIDTMRIHVTGSGNWMMKPTIRAIETDLTGMIQGTVTAEGVCGVSEENVTVMAQVQDDPNDPTSVRVVQAALTVSGSGGSYALAFLPAGTYNVVAYKDGGEGNAVILGGPTEVVVAAGETTTGADIAMGCNVRQETVGFVNDTGVPEGQQDEITPIVTIFVVDDPDYVIAIVGAPWNGDVHRFEVGLPWEDAGFSYEYESDLGTVTID